MINISLAKEHLRLLGLRPTRQRAQLYLMLADAEPIHVTIRDVDERLLLKGRHMSMATLYNNLKTFADVGIIRTITCDGYGMVFDTNTRPHHHVVNVATGEITDTDQIDYVLKENFSVEPGYEIASVEITVKLQPALRRESDKSAHQHTSPTANGDLI